jgi:dihydrodipicolinate synthase/N-acetylneuraminate lyase
VAKAASNLSGRDVGQCRFPVQPLSAAEMAQVEAAYARLRG